MKLALLAAVAVLLAPAAALAQAAPPPPPGLNPMELVTVCTAAYAVLNALASSMRADNTVIAWAPPVVVRVAVVVTGGSIQAGLLLIATGTPWYVVMPTAAFTTYAAWVTSGKRVTPGASTPAAVAEKSSGRPPPMAG